MLRDHTNRQPAYPQGHSKIRLSHWNGRHLAHNRNIGLGWLQRFVQRVLIYSGNHMPTAATLDVAGGGNSGRRSGSASALAQHVVEMRASA